MRPFVRGVAWRAQWAGGAVLSADDLEQHGMEAACRAAMTWRPERGSFKAWAERKAVYAIIDLLRSTRGRRGQDRRPVVTSLDELRSSLDGDEPAPLACHPQVADMLTATTLDRMIASLPVASQTVLDLIFRRDLSGIETAQTLGVSESRISQILHQSLERLRADVRVTGLVS